ncbi:MAG: YkgJ family cysteine cluster protein [Sedimentisphaerales bacterium]|nr:YkgJ family cysteine cluster protein [Sedimentisphaerales bacterium]
MTKDLCKKCTGLCCRYLALPIETPTTKGEYDDIRWYLAHKGISIFVEDGDWYIKIANRCKYLNSNHRCKIYEKRPRICRGYKHEGCDIQPGAYDYELHFTSMEQMEEYMSRKPWKKRKKDKKKKK